MRAYSMGDDINSESTSTIGDDWVKESDISISSLPNDGGKEILSSSSLVSFVSDTESKKMFWVRLLGVQNRPNPLDDWDQLYNLNNQVGLRNGKRFFLFRILMKLIHSVSLETTVKLLYK
ncbi:hypothetical protein ANCCAN_15321 [Ancylostoma caninum]|uniref:Uncharacterized protein n=1 Tax=Ancylostoma caninum TaxID=29170 RepID=A0A368G2T4_ANCCA|nr:hypothetical protein ANCCAN_15321 [Ancylostoma caninum]